MGDADASYDFGEIPRFLEQLRQGAELVQGCRLASGGGRVMPGAMPWLHRWIGNPLFSWLARRWFRAPIHDIHCGMRGFTRQLYESLDQRCTGMEFATEMIIKASLRGEKIAEVPITLHPDGRKSHPPHLRTFRDGWRTFRVDRMQGAVLTGHRFTHAEEPDAEAMVAEGLAVASYAIQARVTLAVPLSEAAAEIPRTVGTLEAGDDGTLLRIGAPDVEWLARYLAGLPFPFEIVDPPELKRELRAMGLRLARQHR